MTLPGEPCRSDGYPTTISVLQVELMKSGSCVDVYETCGHCGFSRLRTRKSV